MSIWIPRINQLKSLMDTIRKFQQQFSGMQTLTRFQSWLSAGTVVLAVHECSLVWSRTNLKFDNFTLDIDSSIITRYGEQEGSAKGYNRHKPGRKSQHPILAFVADIEMVANFWLRSGDAHTANNFKAFLEETLLFMQDKKIGLLRLDSGFYDKDIFDYLEKRESPIDYIVAVPMYVTIQRKISSLKTWLKIENGIEITESHR